MVGAKGLAMRYYHLRSVQNAMRSPESSKWPNLHEPILFVGSPSSTMLSSDSSVMSATYLWQFTL